MGTMESKNSRKEVDFNKFTNELSNMRPPGEGWINTCDDLPPEGKYVVGWYSGGNWIDHDDQQGVNCVVVKRVRADVEGNNKVPYCFSTFGPLDFFGQDITMWKEI